MYKSINIFLYFQNAVSRWCDFMIVPIANCGWMLVDSCRRYVRCDWINWKSQSCQSFEWGLMSKILWRGEDSFTWRTDRLVLRSSGLRIPAWIVCELLQHITTSLSKMSGSKSPLSKCSCYSWSAVFLTWVIDALVVAELFPFSTLGGGLATWLKRGITWIFKTI